MKHVQNLSGILICLLCFSISENLLAQPPYDECINAIDISSAFTGVCGDINLNGQYSLAGSTPGSDDPPEPGEMGVCPNEENPFLFGDASDTWENSIWFTWTVPDLNEDGSNVAYGLWTSDGSLNDDCGVIPYYYEPSETDTQVAIYEGACPTANTGECDHYAANEDLFDTPPWISGWLSIEFTPGQTYYMGVDSWDGELFNFCITVTVCGIECGDDSCDNVENYCDCIADCGDDCPATTIYGVQQTDNGSFLVSPDWSGNVLFCAEQIFGFDNGNLYLTIGGSDENCTQSNLDLPIDLSVGSFIYSDPDGMDTIPAGFFTYIELTPSDLAVGSITITSTQPDGIGNICNTSVTLDLTAIEVSCDISCFAGGIDIELLNNGITVCEDQPFTLNTDGTENLTLPCNSDDGSAYVYVWRLVTIEYGNIIPLTNWQPFGPNPSSIDPATFFINEFSYGPPGSEIIQPNTPDLFLQGAAMCINADGTIVELCEAINEGYENSWIPVTYLPASDPICNQLPEGCTDATACNFDPNVTIDNGSCTYPATPYVDCYGNCLVNIDCAGQCGGTAEEDCEGTCGGTANEGSTCTVDNGETGVYAPDCSCVTTTCEEEISGGISSPNPLCDLGGINLVIIAPDGTSTTVTTSADGTFTIPGGPFPCGIYTASFEDVNTLPSCYTDTGSTTPINFQIDGNPNTIDGPYFTANPTIPTLSQWGLVVLALLLMSFGAIQLIGSLQKSIVNKSHF